MQATPIQYIFPRVYSYTLYKKQSIFHGTILSYLSTAESSGGEQIQINYYTLDNIHIPLFQLRLRIQAHSVISTFNLIISKCNIWLVKTFNRPIHYHLGSCKVYS